MDVPVNFAWTKVHRPSPKKRTISCNETPQSIGTVEELVQEIVGQYVSDDDDDEWTEIFTDTQIGDHLQDTEVDNVVSEKITVSDVSTNTDPVCFKDQNVAVMVHADVQTTEIDTKDAEIQATVINKEASTEINTKLLNDKNASTSTDDLETPLTQFCVETFKDDDKAIRFYTGFPSYMLLIVCYNFLDPAVAHLCYHEKRSGKEASFMGRQRSLTPLNEFFLTLC